jgi:hypothetical protein
MMLLEVLTSARTFAVESVADITGILACDTGAQGRVYDVSTHSMPYMPMGFFPVFSSRQIDVQLLLIGHLDHGETATDRLPMFPRSSRLVSWSGFIGSLFYLFFSSKPCLSLVDGNRHLAR